MEACRHLPIMPLQVHLETLRLEAWGGPTAGHLETERLKLLLQDPRQHQNHQLPLATAGTLDVPKDETGALGCPRFSLPSPKFPRHSQWWVFKLNLATFASFLHRTTCTSFVRSTVNCANLMVIYMMHSLVEYVAGSSAFKAYALNLTADDQSRASVTHQHSPPPLSSVFFSLTPHPTWTLDALSSLNLCTGKTAYHLYQETKVCFYCFREKGLKVVENEYLDCMDEQRIRQRVIWSDCDGN